MKMSKFSRRDFLNVTAGTVGAGLLASCAEESSYATEEAVDSVASATTASVPVGVQLYCFRHMLEEDTPGSLEKIAGIGFTHVETAGYYGLKATELRKLFDDNGLNCMSAHVGIDALGDDIKETADFHAVLGNERLVIPSLPKEMYATKDDLMRGIDRMNGISKTLGERGMKTGYHCHDYTFEQKFDGNSIWKIVTDNTDDDFIMQLDIGNASQGGADIPSVIRDTPGRILSIHAKPYTKGASDPMDAFIGKDALNWPLIIGLLESVGGVDQYIIEYEQEAHPPLEALAGNLAGFKAAQAAKAS